MSDWYTNTTAGELTKEFQSSALKTLKELIEYQRFFVEDLEKAIAADEARAFPIAHPSYVLEKALAIYNEIARSNGAALVRGKKPEEAADGLVSG